MDDTGVAELYRNRFPKEELARKREIWKVVCEHYLQRFVRQDDTVVDLACGYGEFISNISARHKIAIDINPDAAAHLASDIRFELAGATEMGNLVRNEADVVFTSNFLEHLSDKRMLEQVLEQVLVALVPGGRFLVMGPNLRYLPGAYWDFYDHNLGLTHVSLCEVLSLKGFRIYHCVDRFLPYTTRGTLPTHPYFVRLYLSCRPLWRILGKQFFIVAIKPDSNTEDG